MHTWLKGELVGQDDFGNRYFRQKGAPPEPKGLWRERRWVMYQGTAEATKVPPEWHAWLHHQVKDAPTAASVYRKPWQKPHRPNPTGTDQAYRPPGSTQKGGQRAKATGDYEPWTPS